MIGSGAENLNTTLYEERQMMNDRLKQIARRSPEWLAKSVIYQIFLRSFTPEGTLKSAMARLPELADLGVDIVYLCPICLQDDDMRKEFWSDRQKASGLNNSRNPYRIKDYYHIDPEYGTEEDLHKFVVTAHRLGLRVMLDIVFFHCGPSAVFLKDHPDFVKRDEKGEIVNGEWHFPILNYENSELREYLWKNLEYWIREFDVDGYRCDVGSKIPLDFWEEARRRAEKIKSEVIFLDEGERCDDQICAFDLNYSFSWVFPFHSVMAGQDVVSLIRKRWEIMQSENVPGTRFIRFIDNHDIANDSINGRLDVKWGTRAVEASLFLIFMLDGVPFLYNGQEVADKAIHSIYGKVPIQWENANTPEGRARKTFCKQLCALRHTERTLSEGKVVWLENGEPESILSFIRKTEGEVALVVVNLRNDPVKTRIQIPVDTFDELNELLVKNTKNRGKDESGDWVFDLNGYGMYLAMSKIRTI
jgi:glycosidase